MEKTKTTRLSYLDSLRGIAAFGVVFCHLACVFWNAFSHSRYIFFFHRPIILSLRCFVFVRLYAAAPRGQLLAAVAGASILGTLLFSFAYSKFEAFLFAGTRRLVSGTKRQTR